MIFVGCPVLHRAWILDAWFDHVEAALGDRDHRYIFVGDPERDPETWEIIRRRAINPLGVPVEDKRSQDLRRWNSRRFRRMVELRNALLAEVRRHEPELFLSLDSDVLLAPNAIDEMLKMVKPGGAFDAAGSCCYLERKGRHSPSYADLTRFETLRRYDVTGVRRVDCIFAIKLMTPAAYAIDYKHHMQGEDVGWAQNCRAAGVKLGWTGDVRSKHVWCPEDFGKTDERIGW